MTARRRRGGTSGLLPAPLVSHGAGAEGSLPGAPACISLGQRPRRRGPRSGAESRLQSGRGAEAGRPRYGQDRACAETLESRFCARSAPLARRPCDDRPGSTPGRQLVGSAVRLTVSVPANAGQESQCRLARICRPCRRRGAFRPGKWGVDGDRGTVERRRAQCRDHQRARGDPHRAPRPWAQEGFDLPPRSRFS